MKFTLPTFITIALFSGTTSAARSLRGTGDYTLNNASYTTTTDITNSNLPEGNNEMKRALVDNVPLPENIMETKVITNVGVTWETVTLTKAYASPVAVCSVCYTGSQTEPLVVRMRNVVLSSFEIRLQNPGDSITPTSKTVNCLIVEKGKWDMPNGRKIEAQSYTSTSTAAKNAWTGGNQQQQSYLQSYFNPVVLGQVMTFNDPLWSVFFASNGSQDNPPTNNALFTGKHVGEDTNKIRANEIIGFIVMEGGHDASSPIENEASVGSDSVDGYGSSIIGRTYTYQQTFVDIPQVTIVSSAAMDGGDGGWPTLVMDGSQSTDTFQVLIDEDVVGDTERSHTNEQVAYATFSSQGIIPLLSTAPYCFKHVGHCAGGWMGGNVQPSVASCAEQCRGLAGCGFFAYNGSNCAMYLEVNGCPDDNTYNDYAAYYLDCPPSSPTPAPIPSLITPAPVAAPTAPTVPRLLSLLTEFEYETRECEKGGLDLAKFIKEKLIVPLKDSSKLRKKIYNLLGPFKTIYDKRKTIKQIAKLVPKVGKMITIVVEKIEALYVGLDKLIKKLPSEERSKQMVQHLENVHALLAKVYTPLKNTSLTDSELIEKKLGIGVGLAYQAGYMSDLAFFSIDAIRLAQQCSDRNKVESFSKSIVDEVEVLRDVSKICTIIPETLSKLKLGFITTMEKIISEMYEAVQPVIDLIEDVLDTVTDTATEVACCGISPHLQAAGQAISSVIDYGTCFAGPLEGLMDDLLRELLPEIDFPSFSIDIGSLPLYNFSFSGFDFIENECELEFKGIEVVPSGTLDIDFSFELDLYESFLGIDEDDGVGFIDDLKKSCNPDQLIDDLSDAWGGDCCCTARETVHEPGTMCLKFEAFFFPGSYEAAAAATGLERCTCCEDGIYNDEGCKGETAYCGRTPPPPKNVGDSCPSTVDCECGNGLACGKKDYWNEDKYICCEDSFVPFGWTTDLCVQQNAGDSCGTTEDAECAGGMACARTTYGGNYKCCWGTYDCFPWTPECQTGAQYCLGGDGIPYKVFIRTGDVSNAGTDSNIDVIIYGEKGNTGWQRLNPKIDGNAFEKGDTDVAIIYSNTDIGDLKSVSIRTDMSYAGAAWYLNSVTIADKRVAFFDKWIDRQGSAYSGTFEEGKPTDYSLEVRTCNDGFWGNAGTDANIEINLYGYKDGRYMESGWITMNSKLSGNAFEKGDRDYLTLKYVRDLGNVYKVGLKGGYDTWEPDYVKVNGKHFGFGCRQVGYGATYKTNWN